MLRIGKVILNMISSRNEDKRISKRVRSLCANPKNARFVDVARVCEHYFGPPRTHGSHYVFSTPWKGDPRVNIQNVDGMCKPYQVKQVLRAVKRLEDGFNE